MERTRKVQYQLKLSQRRRTISIKVLPSTEVVVHAPSWMHRREIERIIESKSPWIVKHQKKYKEIYREPLYKTYCSGDVFYVLGVPYTLQEHGCVSGGPSIDDQQQVIICGSALSVQGRKRGIRDAYRRIGRSYLDEHLHRLISQVSETAHQHKEPRQVVLRSMSRRWGSCSSGGVITLSLRLFGAPADLVEYVLLHELVHLHHFHHREGFYKLMEQLVPDWKEKRKILEQMSQQLIL